MDMVKPKEKGIRTEPLVVNTGTGGENGLLVLIDGKLVAVLIHLGASYDLAAETQGQWFLEAGFGPCQDWNKGLTFASLDEALAWTCAQVQKGDLS